MQEVPKSGRWNGIIFEIKKQNMCIEYVASQSPHGGMEHKTINQL